MDALESHLIHEIILPEFTARDPGHRPDHLIIARCDRSAGGRVDPGSVGRAWRYDGNGLNAIEASEVPSLRDPANFVEKAGEAMPLYREGVADVLLNGDQLWIDFHYGPTKGHGAAYQVRSGEKIRVKFLGIRWINQGE